MSKKSKEYDGIVKKQGLINTQLQHLASNKTISTTDKIDLGIFYHKLLGKLEVRRIELLDEIEVQNGLNVLFENVVPAIKF